MPPPKWQTRLALVVLGVVSVWGLATIATGAAAWSELRAARSAAAELRDDVAEADDLFTDGFEHRLQDVADRFGRAHDRLDAPWMAPARFVPVVGRQLRSATALSGATTDVLQTAERARSAAVAELDAGLDEPSRRVEATRVLEQVMEDLLAEVRATDLGPDDRLLGPLARARADVAEELANLEDQAASAVTLLGALELLLDGPSTYAVFAANNAEMRSGSGMFLSAGTLQVSGGSVALADMRSVTALPQPKDVDVSGDLATHWSWLEPNRDWRNLMLSPRFPASAELAARMWSASQLGEVDGVIAIDPIGLARVVEVVGPLDVGNRMIDAEDVTELLLHDQYLEFDGYEENDQRRDLLGDIADVAFAEIDGGGYDFAELVVALADASSGRHVMIWSRDADQQRAWEEVRAAGELASDTAMVSIVNRGANKLDQFLKVKVALDQAEPDDGLVPMTMAIAVRNATPPGEPTYVAGPHPALDLDPGDYRGIVVATLPATAGDVRIDGVEFPTLRGRDGETRLIGHPIELPAGRATEVVVRFTLPATQETLTVAASARHPASRWTYQDLSWRDDRHVTLTLRGERA